MRCHPLQMANIGGMNFLVEWKLLKCKSSSIARNIYLVIFVLLLFLFYIIAIVVTSTHCSSYFGEFTIAQATVKRKIDDLVAGR